MSALTPADLYRLEYQVRVAAERIRLGNPEAEMTDPAIPSDVRAHIRNERARAADFDLIGNMLAGLQGDWERLGPQVRAGYARLRQDYATRNGAGDTKWKEDDETVG